MKTKKCIYCNKEYPRTTEYFYKSAKNKNFFNSACKKCLIGWDGIQSERIKKRRKELEKTLNIVSCELMHNLNNYFTIEFLSAKYEVDYETMLEIIVLGSGELKTRTYKEYILNKNNKLKMIEREIRNEY